MRFFYREMRDRLFVIRKSLKIDFRHELRTHQLTELVGEKPELHGNTGSPSVGNGLGFVANYNLCDGITPFLGLPFTAIFSASTDCQNDLHLLKLMLKFRAEPPAHDQNEG